MKVISFITLTLSLFLTSAKGFAQAGITASPARLYFRQMPGLSAMQKINVSNPNNINIEVGISMGDWEYDSKGDNRLLDPGSLKTSCASWIKVLPGSYFTLMPNERKELFVELKVPDTLSSAVPVHTAMLYLTQLNPGNFSDANGASLRVSVRMGIKVYHSFSKDSERDIEITNFADKKLQRKDNAAGNALSVSLLEINFENTGKIWVEGKIRWELFNQGTGEKIKLKDDEFLSLPGDKRIIQHTLPANLKSGQYSATAIINYGNKDELKIVELEFEH